MSHTVSVDIKLKNKEALVKAAEAVGAKVLGEANHRLYSSSHQGLGIQLKGWQYPIVVNEEGSCSYDNYNGCWGSLGELERLTAGYAVAVFENQCDALGWYHERNDATGEVVVHHPSGGTITVSSGGTLDAQNFHGANCQDATLPLEQALGRRLGETLKPEVNEVQLNQKIVGD